MAKLIRKNVLLDPEVLRQAQKILNTRSASVTIREALNLVVLHLEIIQGFDQVAGKSPGVSGHVETTVMIHRRFDRVSSSLQAPHDREKCPRR